MKFTGVLTSLTTLALLASACGGSGSDSDTVSIAPPTATGTEI